jgi:FlaA1/EpsC-like NDP-sugar epimerase
LFEHLHIGSILDQIMSDATIRDLAREIVGRPNSFLDSAVQDSQSNLESAFKGRRILILGAAGFIARQTLLAVLPYRPAYVGLVDISENGLAEVIRGLRASNAIPVGTIVEPWLADIGSAIFPRILAEIGAVDRVMNFAAVKHVRSERDVPSILRMLEVNILATYKAVSLIAELQPRAAQFVVSTDKAADPANFMGASKRAMELAAVEAFGDICTARFANVAFSSGSLLESWLRRISERLPVAVPRDTWRYFVTPEEAGHLCMLASLAPAGSVVVPSFENDDLVELEKILMLVLRRYGYQGREVSDVCTGINLMKNFSEIKGAEYPIVVSERDTPGEKREEQFLASGEKARPWISELGVSSMKSSDTGAPEITEFVHRIESLVSNPNEVTTVDDLRIMISNVVPNFTHVSAKVHLDDRA